MKTKNITLTLAAAAATAITGFTFNAAEPLLSPSARDNQIRPGLSITKDGLQCGLLSDLLCWRNYRINVVRDVNNDPNPVNHEPRLPVSPCAPETLRRPMPTTAEKHCIAPAVSGAKVKPLAP